MNEGLADFFFTSLSGDPRVGRYVGVMGLGLRDLSQFRAVQPNSRRNSCSWRADWINPIGAGRNHRR